MKLSSGVEKFQTLVFPKMKDDFQRLAHGQSPATLFITCSDSRIDPNLITQTQPGELFVIRNAGNIVPKPGTGELAVEATIQYAVGILKVKQIVVCGHSHCGAVTGLLNLESLDATPAIKNWVKKSEGLFDRAGSKEIEVGDAIRQNVMLQLDHLMEYAYVAKAVEAGELELHGWVYHFENGLVEFVSEEMANV